MFHDIMSLCIITHNLNAMSVLEVDMIVDKTE